MRALAVVVLFVAGCVQPLGPEPPVEPAPPAPRSELPQPWGWFEMQFIEAVATCARELCFVVVGDTNGGAIFSSNSVITGFWVDVVPDQPGLAPGVGQHEFRVHCAVDREGHIEICPDEGQALATSAGPAPFNWTVHGLSLAYPKGLAFSMHKTGPAADAHIDTGASYRVFGQLWSVSPA